MNTFSKTSFRQKLFKGAQMIIILLQTACATQFSMVGQETNEWTASNPSKLTANDAGAVLVCRTDMPEKTLTQAMVEPLVQNDAHRGAEVFLLLRNQQEIAGRLLAVRDSALVIATNETPLNYLGAQSKNFLVVGIRDILRVRSKYNETSHKGAFTDFLIGAGVGAIIGYSFGDDLPPADSDCAFGAISFQFTAEGKALLGGILGGLAGAMLGSAVDKANDGEIRHDLSALKPYAQFPEKEPEYLNAVK